MSFKSGQKKKKKEKKERILKKESGPHLASKASLLIYLTVVLNLESQISFKIVFLCVSFWTTNENTK